MELRCVLLAALGRTWILGVLVDGLLVGCGVEGVLVRRYVW